LNQKILTALHQRWWITPIVSYIFFSILSAVIASFFISSLTTYSVGHTIPGYTVYNSHGPTWGSLVSQWDAEWYHDIARYGYETTYDPDSGLITNWAFFPLYPTLIKLISLTGVPLWLAGTLISFVAGFIGVVVMFKTIYQRSNSLWLALFTILPILASPAFFLFQSNYTEGLALLVVAMVLYNIINKRYLWTAGWLLVASVTRGIGVPLCVLVAGVLLYDLWKTRRVTWKMVVVGFAAVFAAGFWPLLVGFTFGRFDMSLHLLSIWGTWVKYPLTIMIGLPLVLLIVQLLARRLPWEWILWTVAYSAYIVGTTVMTTGIMRYLLVSGLSLGALVHITRGKHQRILLSVLLVALIVFSVVGQIWWQGHIWIHTSDTLISSAVP